MDWLLVSKWDEANPNVNPENEREHAERTRDQHSNREQRLRIRFPASPSTEAETHLEGEQRPEQNRDEQPDEEQWRDGLHALVWGPGNKRS
jgi:hypothetical protein